MLLDPSLHPLSDPQVTRCCYLAGRWVPVPGAACPMVTDPATESPLVEVALEGAVEVDQAVQAARDAFDAWSGRTPAARAQLLERLQTLLAQRADTFAQVICREMGARLAAARALQVPLALEHLRVAREVVGDYGFERAWRPRRSSATEGFRRTADCP